MTDWKWPGSRWWRIDLHAHTPESRDFKAPAGTAEPDWQAWVNAAVAAGLHAVAVTDHNSPNGIPDVQTAARAQELVVFPGVEVTVGQVHLLCLFGPEHDRDAVFSLLNKLEIGPSGLGEQSTFSVKGIHEAIDIANHEGALVIGAHVNGPKGLFRALAGEPLHKALGRPGLRAVELAPRPGDAEKAKEYLDPEGEHVRELLAGTKWNRPPLTPVFGSDAHAPDELGRRSTWVKMTEPDLEGLELALLDGTESVKPGDANAHANRHAELAIESIRITDAKYMGRGAPLEVRLNPWLNAIIGGRGTGKSTLVDFCRAALRRGHELTGELKEAYEQRIRVPPSRQEEGLATNNTLVEVTYRKDGERFVIRWSPSGSAQAITRLEGAATVPEAGSVSERFPVRIYSQKQLFHLARQPDALLGVIDDTSAVNGVDLKRQLDGAEARYLALLAEARAQHVFASSLSARRAELQDVHRKLLILQQGDHLETLHRYRTIQHLDGVWKAIQKKAREAVANLEQAADDLVVPDLELQVPGEDAAVSALGNAHANLKEVIADYRRQIRQATDATRSRLLELRLGADDPVWTAAVARCERVVADLAEKGIADPEEYRKLLQRETTLGQEIRDMEAHLAQVDLKREAAQLELLRYRELRNELTRRRSQFASSASSEDIKISVEPSARGALDDRLEETLRTTLGGDGFQRDRDQLRELIHPQNEPWSFASLDDTVRDLRATLDGQGGSYAPRDRRSVSRLTPEALDRLALFLPDDRVEVQFRDGTNGAWRSLAQGSPGQQTAALLAFVLSYGDEPILLDQPEDDLDNVLIYSLLVQRLRATKPTRQIIVITHNPNIVVHGDAELVISLAARGGQSHVVAADGLQRRSIRTNICAVMEGGTKAFETRYQRIMVGAQTNGDP